MGVKVVHKETGEVLWSGDGDSLWGANLSGADLESANLVGVNLFGADLEGTNLRRADLRGANLAYATLLGATLEGATLLGANLQSATLGGANLRKANLESATLRGANLTCATLLGANLLGANLLGANLLGADLRKANLESVNLGGANLTCADLRGAHLKNACFEAANLSGCRRSWFWGWLGLKKVSRAAQLGVAPQAALLGCTDVGKAKPGSPRPPASEIAGVLELREALQKLRGLAPAEKLAQLEHGLETLEQLIRVLPDVHDETVIGKIKTEAALLEDTMRREVQNCQKQAEEARASLLWKEAEQVRLQLAGHTSET